MACLWLQIIARKIERLQQAEILKYQIMREYEKKSVAHDERLTDIVVNLEKVVKEETSKDCLEGQSCRPVQEEDVFYKHLINTKKKTQEPNSSEALFQTSIDLEEGKPKTTGPPASPSKPSPASFPVSDPKTLPLKLTLKTLSSSIAHTEAYFKLRGQQDLKPSDPLNEQFFDKLDQIVSKNLIDEQLSSVTNPNIVKRRLRKYLYLVRLQKEKNRKKLLFHQKTNGLGFGDQENDTANRDNHLSFDFGKKVEGCVKGVHNILYGRSCKTEISTEFEPRSKSPKSRGLSYSISGPSKPEMISKVINNTLFRNRPLQKQRYKKPLTNSFNRVKSAQKSSNPWLSSKEADNDNNLGYRQSLSSKSQQQPYLTDQFGGFSRTRTGYEARFKQSSEKKNKEFNSSSLDEAQNILNMKGIHECLVSTSADLDPFGDKYYQQRFMKSRGRVCSGSVTRSRFLSGSMGRPHTGSTEMQTKAQNTKRIISSKEPPPSIATIETKKPSKQDPFRHRIFLTAQPPGFLNE